MPSNSPVTPTTRERRWRVTLCPFVDATSPEGALDEAEQQLRASGARGVVRVDVLCELTGETATRIVGL